MLWLWVGWFRALGIVGSAQDEECHLCETLKHPNKGHSWAPHAPWRNERERERVVVTLATATQDVAARGAGFLFRCGGCFQILAQSVSAAQAGVPYAGGVARCSAAACAACTGRKAHRVFDIVGS